MRVVIQRVSKASVTVEGQKKSSISGGLLVFAGFEEADTIEDLRWMGAKIAALRIFNDEAGLMNKCVRDVDGEILVVSQFTLWASYRKGNRPSYMRAAKPDVAVQLYETFVKMLESEISKTVETGSFGAHMEVELINDGPVTIVMDSKHPE